MMACCTECERPVCARGLCRYHYREAHKRGFSEDLRVGKRPTRPCSVDGCDRHAQSVGYCWFHYQKLRRYGDPLHETQQRTGRRFERGYVALWRPDHPASRDDGYVLEHRMLWWDTHGPIPDGWQIHHINGIKDDNRLENLVALTNEAHQAVHAAEAESVVNQFGVWPRRAPRPAKVLDRVCRECGGLIPNAKRADALYCCATCTNRAGKRARRRSVSAGFPRQRGGES